MNTILVKLGILQSNFNFLGTAWSAKIIIIVALIWRWTGYNMVFFLAGLQNIEYSVYEAAKIDGASGWQTFWKITVPLLKPTIVKMCIRDRNKTRLSGVEEAYEQFGMPINKELLFMNLESRAFVEKAVDDALNRKTDCILCMDDGICSQAMGRLRQRHVKVPDEVKIASFYNSSVPVSYTHLDVYKRQALEKSLN